MTVVKKSAGRIVFVRHAIAMDRTIFQQLDEGPDRLRPLTEKGIRKMRQNAKGLKRLLGRQEVVVISSPFTRALQTADILIEILGTEKVRGKEVWSELQPMMAPRASLNPALQKIRQARKTRNENIILLIVGHEPGLSLLISKLLKLQTWTELRKGAAVSLSCESIGRNGFHSELDWALKPSGLRLIR